jgi:glycosyltransferase involved in cell wall biosynthesis
MRALPTLLAGLPSAQVLIIGQEGHGYGFRPAPPEGWKARYLGEVKGRVDLARVHFTGKLPHPQMLTALKASAAHVYYSYPYVLSWSLLEAMAAGALVLASDTAPVRDVIAHGQNGLLGDFFDAEGLARRLITVCNRPEDFQRLRDGARRTALERYDRDTVCLPAWLALVEDELRRA